MVKRQQPLTRAYAYLFIAANIGIFGVIGQFIVITGHLPFVAYEARMVLRGALNGWLILSGIVLYMMAMRLFAPAKEKLSVALSLARIGKWAIVISAGMSLALVPVTLLVLFH